MSIQVSRTHLLSTLKKLYPVSLAESWDNVGLLVDTPIPDTTPLKILLTIDLTSSVANEALTGGFNFIVAYHPFIFSGIKKISPRSNPQHDSLVKLITGGVSVYSPHTVIDSIKGGVNDWLVEGLVSSDMNQVKSSKVINEVEEGVGCGRLVTLKESVKVSDLIPRIKSHLQVDNLLVSNGSLPKQVTTIAVCAGSGASVFKGVDADLYYTGELSHHEILFLKEQGKAVICANHSNTERGYLKRVKEDLERQGFSGVVEISQTDKDPLQFV
ncbi:hypothetical protein WICPIJ_004597 [Wickerhamomyces pijperi]|uniref:YbgI/family dinuclear metal center protein n=1 Tax=Wickerhamomyces pijperi TaxID=599730 RepID=A0A9P8TN42_WICPI|nr:hypothetical protein WICPIJ_004597 [Wickerhamomyces pijperi]